MKSKTYFDEFTQEEIAKHTRQQYEEMIKIGTKPFVQLYAVTQDEVDHPRCIGVSQDLVKDGLKGFVQYVGFSPTPYHLLKRKNVDWPYDPANVEWKLGEDTERIVVEKVAEFAKQANSPEEVVNLLNKNKIRDLSGAREKWNLSRVLWFLDNYRIEVESGIFQKALKAIRELRAFVF